MVRPVHRVAVIAAVSLVLAACNGGDDTTGPTDPPVATEASGTDSTSTSTSTEPESTPVSTATTTTSGSTTVAGESTTTTTTSNGTTDTTSPDDTGAVDTWQAALTATAAGGDVAAVASPTAVEAFEAFAQFLSEPLVFHTVASGTDPVTIEECLLTPGSETGALFLRGEVSSDGTTVESLEFGEAFGGCVPAEVNDAALAAYDEYWEAFPEFMGPPNADDPRLDELVTGSYREFLGDLMQSLLANNEEFRGSPVLDAHVIRYVSPTQVLIGDCQEIPTDFGTYAAGTDDRTDTFGAAEPGRTDFQEVTMTHDGNGWKITQFAGEANSPCETVGSDRAVTVVGAAT